MTCSDSLFILQSTQARNILQMVEHYGPDCSKLTISLANEMLYFQMYFMQTQ